MPSDLRVICDELRQIGLHKETPAGRKTLNESLSSKWDGVRVAAAKALSQWGDARSVRNLKELLVEVATEPRRSSTTSAVVKSLRPHLQFSDLDWVIEIFVHRSHGHHRRAVGGLFQAFPPNEVRERLIAQKLHGGTAERDVRSAIAGAEWRAGIRTRSR